MTTRRRFRSMAPSDQRMPASPRSLASWPAKALQPAWPHQQPRRAPAGMGVGNSPTRTCRKIAASAFVAAIAGRAIAGRWPFARARRECVRPLRVPRADGTSDVMVARASKLEASRGGPLARWRLQPGSITGPPSVESVGPLRRRATELSGHACGTGFVADGAPHGLITTAGGRRLGACADQSYFCAW